MNLINNIDLSKFNRYIELVLGEAEALNELNPQITCLLNDSNTDLISFYKYIQEPELQQELKLFVQNWELIGEFANFSSNEILIAFQDLNQGIISSEDVEYMIRAIVMMNMLHDKFIPLFEQKFVVSIDLFNNALINPVVEALLQLKGDNLLADCQTVEECFKGTIETAFKKGFFRHFRSLLNWQKTELIDCISLRKHLSCWMFIKEFSKEPHLNYDKNGNIKNHYGGSSIDSKSFSSKVEAICNPSFTSKLENSSLFNQTPLQFVKENKADKQDLIVINLSNTNLILSTGKNYSGIGSLLEQIKQIVQLDLSLLVITEDKKLALEFETISEGRLNSTSANGIIYLSTI